MSLFKTKDYGEPKCVKTVYGGGKKQSEVNKIKCIRNLFKLKKENEAIKQDDYYKPIRVANFWNNNYIEYESSGDRNKNL